MGWHSEHDLCCSFCNSLHTIAMSIKEAGQGNWPPCPDCGAEMTKVFTKHEARYMARDFQQRENIIKSNRPSPGSYRPVN